MELLKATAGVKVITAMAAAGVLELAMKCWWFVRPAEEMVAVAKETAAMRAGAALCCNSQTMLMLATLTRRQQCRRRG